MRRLLEAYLKKEIASADLTIHYVIAGGLGGETNFRLHGDGRYELYSNVTLSHQRKRYSGQVSVSQVENVAQKMLATKIWQVWHDHESRGLDESGAKITVAAHGQKSEVMLWVSEIRESPAFARVQRQLLSLIHEISQGEVLEKGHGTFHLFPETEGQQTAIKRFWSLLPR